MKSTPKSIFFNSGSDMHITNLKYNGRKCFLRNVITSYPLSIWYSAYCSFWIAEQLNEAKALLNQPDVCVNCVDEVRLRMAWNLSASLLIFRLLGYLLIHNNDNEYWNFSITKNRLWTSIKTFVKTDALLQTGMTPLQHASYHGDLALVELLLSLGADVNSNQHKEGYTALMFGALSGSVDVVSRLLDAGARTTRTNSVGRTASQMAAFVGQHQVWWKSFIRHFTRM